MELFRTTIWCVGDVSVRHVFRLEVDWWLDRDRDGSKVARAGWSLFVPERDELGLFFYSVLELFNRELPASLAAISTE
jgi:hypothetical protein